jgi:hypothetical protein
MYKHTPVAVVTAVTAAAAAPSQPTCADKDVTTQAAEQWRCPDGQIFNPEYAMYGPPSHQLCCTVRLCLFASGGLQHFHNHRLFKSPPTWFSCQACNVDIFDVSQLNVQLLYTCKLESGPNRPVAACNHMLLYNITYMLLRAADDACADALPCSLPKP